ncbi:MAG: response regulator, partial [Oscillospiraceae bacterium]
MAKTALIIEDDGNIAELLRLYLEKDGFEVSIAADGGTGVQMALEQEPSLILLDIMLPVLDGWQVCAKVR